MSEDPDVYVCPVCEKNKVDPRRWEIGRKLCPPCGEEAAKTERESWCVLTPHKQGGMYFTPESAREMAKGINNKGGLIK